MSITEQILSLARQLASETLEFHAVKGPGVGDRASNTFMKELRSRALCALGRDYSEKQICGDIKSAVDFYIPEEKTVIEVAMSLRDPLSEFHKDIFKVLLARDSGAQVEHLVFLAKPGGLKRHQEPASQAIIRWLKKYYSICARIEEFEK